MSAATETAVTVRDIPPAMVREWLSKGECVLVDVREDYEHAEERIDGAVSRPLSKFDAPGIKGEFAGRRVVFHCRSGKRSRDAATRFGATGPGEVFYLDGGIEGWKTAGHAVTRAKKAGLPIIRQVMLVAGTMVMAGVALGAAVSPWFYGLSAFVGAGLFFAGATGWCGMAMLLGKMPWNRVAGTPGGGASCAV